MADLEISNNVTLPEPYCTIYGQRDSLICDATLGEVRVRHLDPEYKMPEICVQNNTTVYNCSDDNIPWIEKNVTIEHKENMWEYMDRKLIGHLYDNIKKGIPSFVVSASMVYMLDFVACRMLK